MDLVIIVVLIVTSAILGLYDTYVVQRTYADICAERHGHIPPLVDWFFQADVDPDVDYWRRRHRNLYIFGCVPALVAIVLLLARASSGG